MNRPLPGFAARAFRWSPYLGRIGAIPVGLLAAEILLAAIAFQLLGFWLKRPFGPATTGLFLGFFLAGQILGGGAFRARRFEFALLRAGFGNLLALVAYAVARKHLRGVVSPITFGETLLGLFPLQAVLWYLLARLDRGISVHPRSRRLGRLGADALRWPDRSERNGRWAFSLMLADGLAAAGVAMLVGAFWLEQIPALPDLLALAAIITGSHTVVLTYAHTLSRRRFFLAARIAAGNALAWVLLTHRAIESPHPAPLAPTLVVFAGVQGILHAWHRRRTETAAGAGVLDPLRAAILAAALLWLHQPLLTTGAIGAGDSYWYNIMIADFVSQWRDGIFPVFAGQTEFAFNGALAPVRFAPALQHFAGTIDLLTRHRLSFNGITNLTLLSCFAGGAFVCCGCLRAMAPRRPTLALLLALLYSSCPGVLALAYTGDLFMSVTAVAFVPLAFYGCWRTLTDGDLRSVLLMVFALAVLWYCHPPIALWCTMAAAVTQLTRLFREARRPMLYLQWIAGAAVFGLLVCYCLVSVGTATQVSNPVDPRGIVDTMRTAFPGTLRAVSKDANELGDYQLGWSLWASLLAAAVAAPFLQRRSAVLALLAAAVGILLFVLPIPGVLDRAWAWVPRAVCDITFLWPMQRLYVILAGLAAVTAAGALGPLLARRPIPSFFVGLALAFGCRWSFTEAGKFQRHVTITPPDEMRRELRPQNLLLTRYAFNTFATSPPYFSHGFIDPMMTSRLFVPATGAQIFSPLDALEHDPSFAVRTVSGEFTTSRASAEFPHLRFEPKLRLEPHRRYFLEFGFAHPELEGSLRFVGPHLSRGYWLPDSGYGVTLISPSRAFGTRPGMAHGITLWTDGDEPEEVSLAFYFNDVEHAPDVRSFGHYTLTEFDPARFPIQVTQWAPYRARVDSPTAAALETPREFIAGYQARINGRPVPVSRSPDSLVMVPVPAGKSTVEISYRGPLLLRCAYFASAAGGLALFALLLLGRRQRSEEAA
ncbi:MAG TPA: hypothetical protein VG838_11975 [Opitutaceae bacterium]|nr:hypothetical protein [Opitutaceae bacterium]